VSLASVAAGAFLAARILGPTMGSGALWSRRVSIALGTMLVIAIASVVLKPAR
jgi:hypothetical protein